MQDIYSEIVRALERKERCVLATLINRWALPKSGGCEIFDKARRHFFGFHWRGCVEAEVWQEAQKVADKGEGESTF